MDDAKPPRRKEQVIARSDATKQSPHKGGILLQEIASHLSVLAMTLVFGSVARSFIGHGLNGLSRFPRIKKSFYL
jgi:hypothetical protein